MIVTEEYVKKLIDLAENLDVAEHDTETHRIMFNANLNYLIGFILALKCITPPKEEVVNVYIPKHEPRINYIKPPEVEVEKPAEVPPTLPKVDHIVVADKKVCIDCKDPSSKMAAKGRCVKCYAKYHYRLDHTILPAVTKPQHEPAPNKGSNWGNSDKKDYMTREIEDSRPPKDQTMLYCQNSKCSLGKMMHYRGNMFKMDKMYFHDEDCAVDYDSNEKIEVIE